MTPEELPSQPRKASWKRRIVVLAGALAIVLAVLFLKAPSPEPVSIKFVRSTDWLGSKALVFKGTNGLPRTMLYHAYVVPDSIPRSKYESSLARHNISNGAPVEAGKAFTFFLQTPPDRTDWYVVWWFTDTRRPVTRLESFRTRCAEFFRAHGMRKLEKRFGLWADAHFLSPSELKE